jgi:ankyrin repeat protein
MKKHIFILIICNLISLSSSLYSNNETTDDDIAKAETDAFFNLCYKSAIEQKEYCKHHRYSGDNRLRHDSGYTLIEWAVFKRADPTLITAIAQTKPSQIDNALFIAINHEDAQTVQVLLEHGANVNAIDFLGHTPLHTCMRQYDAMQYGKPLHKARKIIAQMLINHSADTDARDRYGNKPSDFCKTNIN